MVDWMHHLFRIRFESWKQPSIHSFKYTGGPDDLDWIVMPIGEAPPELCQVESTHLLQPAFFCGWVRMIHFFGGETFFFLVENLTNMFFWDLKLISPTPPLRETSWSWVLNGGYPGYPYSTVCFNMFFPHFPWKNIVWQLANWATSSSFQLPELRTCVAGRKALA